MKKPDSFMVLLCRFFKCAGWKTRYHVACQWPISKGGTGTMDTIITVLPWLTDRNYKALQDWLHTLAKKEDPSAPARLIAGAAHLHANGKMAAGYGKAEV